MNHWHDIHSRQLIPPAHLAIPEVFEAIGRKYYAETGEWDGSEWKFVELGDGFPKPSFIYEGNTDFIKDPDLYARSRRQVQTILGIPDPLLEPLSNRQWCEASDKWHAWWSAYPSVTGRRNQVFSTMHRLGMSGHLRYCFIASNGEIRELDPSQWNCSFEVARDRFEHAALNTNTLFTMHRPDPWGDGRGYLEHFTMPIFVHKRCVLEVLPHIRYHPPSSAPDDLIKSRVDALMEEVGASQPTVGTQTETGEILPREPAQQDNTVRNGMAGRPSAKHIVFQLLEQRAANGDMIVGNLAAEAEAILRAFTADRANASIRPPTPKTIKNNIRHDYNRLCREARN